MLLPLLWPQIFVSGSGKLPVLAERSQCMTDRDDLFIGAGHKLTFHAPSPWLAL